MGRSINLACAGSTQWSNLGSNEDEIPGSNLWKNSARVKATTALPSGNDACDQSTAAMPCSSVRAPSSPAVLFVMLSRSIRLQDELEQLQKYPQLQTHPYLHPSSTHKTR